MRDRGIGEFIDCAALSGLRSVQFRFVPRASPWAGMWLPLRGGKQRNPKRQRPAENHLLLTSYPLITRVLSPVAIPVPEKSVARPAGA